MFSDFYQPSVHHPPLRCRPLLDSLWATTFWPFSRQTFSAREIARKITAKNRWPWQTHRDSLSDSHSWWWSRFGTKCVRCPMCGSAWTTCHKMAGWLLNCLVAGSHYRSYVCRPLPTFRTPPPNACCRPLMDWVWVTTFWPFRRQFFCARSI